MASYKKYIQLIYYNIFRKRLNGLYRSVIRIFVNLRNSLVFRSYGRRVHWDPGVIFESPYNITVGDRCRIKKGVEMYADPWVEDKDKVTLVIGDNVSINSGTFINAHNYVEIGEGTLIGKNVIIADTKHNVSDPGKTIRDNPVTLEDPIIIGKGCGIAFNVMIFPGVTLGENSGVSANSVVTRDVPPYSIVGGIPARIVRRYDFEKKKWIKYNDEGRPEE